MAKICEITEERKLWFRKLLLINKVNLIYLPYYLNKWFKWNYQHRKITTEN